MKRYVLSIVAAIIVSAFSQAKVYDKLVLKDGSVVEGYITIQHPGKDMMVNVEKQTIKLKADRISSISDEEVTVSSRSKAWQDWLNDHPQMVKDGKYVTLSRIYLKPEVDSVAVSVADTVAVDSVAEEEDYAPYSTNETSTNLVRIIERGAIVSYVGFTPTVKTFQMSEIRSIERVARKADDLSGLVDVIETSKGQTYRGQIISQTPGEYIRLLQDDNMIQVVKSNEIRCQKKEKLNPDQDIFEQAPFLDIVLTGRDSYRGIITLQDYGSAKEPSYLLIQDEYNQVHRVEIKAIKEMQRTINDKYNLMTDLHISAEEVYFNGKSATPVAYSTERNGDFKISAEAIDTRAILNSNEGDSGTGKLLVEMEDNAENRSAILIQVSPSKTGKLRVITFSYQDLVTSPIPAQSTATIRKTLRKEYTAFKGYYILYTPQGKKAYLCEIQ